MSILTEKIIKEKRLRVRYFEHDFFNFCLYYLTETFWFKSAQFHKDYCRELQNETSILFNWFRESWKTVLLKYYILWCICYNKKSYIVFFCDEKKKAQDKILDVAKQLQWNKKIINDFWRLFHDPSVWWNISTKKRIGDFETTNHIKVEAMGMGEIFRWKVYWVPAKWEKRPDLVCFDDIDTKRSVNTTDLVDKWYEYIKNEVYWWLSDDWQVVFLYNTIKEDWVWPRLVKDHKDLSWWKCFFVPIRDSDWNITRPERYTDEQIEKKKKQAWDIAFNQNYMLIPYSWWDSVVKRSMIQYHDKVDWFEKVIISIDPAISTKEQSDLFAICVTWIIWDDFYVLDCIWLQAEQKEIWNAISIIRNLYNKYNANYVIVESVAFQKVIWHVLSRSGIATQEVYPHRDKLTRLLEKEHLFSQGRVYFSKLCNQLVEDLLVFPNGKYDDRVDALVYSLEINQEIDIEIL